MSAAKFVPNDVLLNADGKPTIAEAPAPQKHGKPRNKEKAARALAEMKPQMTLF